MAKVGDELTIPPLGLRIVFLRTADETGGELLEYEVSGRPRGFPAQGHVHPHQSERHEVLGGSLQVSLEGRDRILTRGESVVIQPGTPHRHYAAGTGEAHVRVELRPALRTEELLERLAALAESGDVTRRGYLKPLAAARLIHDFPDEGHAARPPVGVQRAFARGVIALAERAERGSREYVFVDEWNVDAPREAVFDALADGRTYPAWWRPVYIDVDADGPPRLGQVARQHFKGQLPYHLKTTSKIVRYDPPHVLDVEVEGDLRGHGKWTLTPTAFGGTHVRFDWTVHADRRLLRVLTPVLRPLFRWNHNWAIARAIEGLEPYVRRGTRGR
jgi:quercetin dioxygenase-like cupin family protein/uncharacterized protein YndB with AHSA1/START domain